MSERIYIVDTPIGVFALNPSGEVVDSLVYPRDVGKVVEEMLLISESKASNTLFQLLESLKSKIDVSSIVLVFEDSEIARQVGERGFKTAVESSNAVARNLRRELPVIAVKLGIFKTEDDYREYVHQISLELTRRKLRRFAQKRDLLAIQAIRAIDDIDKTLNLLAARLREWYSIHFPELDDISKEHEEYIRIVAELGFRDNIVPEALIKLGISEGRAKKIAEASKQSIGADLSEMDMSIIQTVANIWLELFELRQKLTDYITQVMKEVAPNVTALVGPLLGARLLSLAGSLEELAKLPASTVQVLGAEKALFRALRTGGKPPKHGVIFQFPEIRKAPKWQRGKISRALATKLSIAARIDFFTGRYVGEELKQKLMERIEEIKKLYPKPPKKEAKEARPRPRREGRREGRK
ncbi:MAG: C/D box methylation guide ribonucleoprotein complex aNOP56 subunit [Ignisphaera sp.]